jgi:cell division septation protein DedD
LLSLNWMLLRRLWVAALYYVGAVVAATLLLFGIGRMVFQISDATQWALLLLGLLLCVAVPGAYGNAWLYAACNQKMERALAASATLEDACAQLARQAAGIKRMLLLAGLNVALCLAVVGIVRSWPSPAALPLHTGPATQVQVAGLVQSGLVTQSLDKPVALPSPTGTASQPAESPVLPAPVAAPITGTTETVEAIASEETTKTAVSPKPTKAEKLAKAKAAKAAKAAAKAESKAAKAAMTAKADPVEKAAKVAKVAAAAASAPGSGPYLINVGLFADPNNARNAFVKLQDAGLPAVSQELKSSKGPRTRVRVGPFESQAEADRAAERIRALQLEAAVIRQ